MPRSVNRVGTEAQGNIGESYARATSCDSRDGFLATASRDRSELITAELDFDRIREVRDAWQFYRDRRPDSCEAFVAP